MLDKRHFPPLLNFGRVEIETEIVKLDAKEKCVRTYIHFIEIIQAVLVYKTLGHFFLKVPTEEGSDVPTWQYPESCK